MKKIILALCICALVCTVGCASSDDELTKSEVKTTTTKDLSDSVSQDDTQKADESSEEIADESMVESVESSLASNDEDIITVDPKYDPVIINEGVVNAVNENNPVSAYIDGYYNFSYEGFGTVYSNEELKKCFDRINEICNNANFTLAFSYENMDTGASVNYNQYTRFMTCSTIKAPYVKSILSQGINLDDVLSRDYSWVGDTDADDIVANMEYGTKLTARELIEYTIHDSDNTAYYMLCQNYGYQAFNNNQYTIGSNYYLGDSWIFTYCTSLDMEKSYEDIYRFAEENEQGKWLVELLSDTALNIQIGKALGGKYTVAQKYGSEFNESVFNDCAIVYADSPFVLCIMTNQRPETEESCKVFKDLAVVFDDINTLIAQ